MTTKKFGRGCISTVTIFTALLITGGYGLSKGWHQFFWGTELTPLEAAKIIPEEVFITGYINTSLTNWSQLEQFNSSKNETIVNYITEEINQKFSQENLDINYQEDISPWLGNMAIAFFPKISPSLNSSWGVKPDADLLMIFGIKNPLKAYQFRQSIKSQGKAKYQESKYRGVTITSIAQSSPTKIYLTVLRNKLVITDKLSIMHQAIATYKGEPALANNPESNQIFKQKLDLENPLMQIYLTNYQQLLDKTFPIDAMTFGFGSETKAIKLKTITNFNQSVTLELPKGEQEILLENFPESTIALVSSQINGIKISDTWSYFMEDYYPYLAYLLRAKYNLSQWLAIVSDYQDFFQLIDGEFSLGIALSQTAEDIETNLATGLILTMSDRHRTELALEQLLDHYPVIQPHNVNLNQNFSYRWLKDNNLLLAWSQNQDNLIFNQIDNNIKNNQKFMNFFQDIPKKNITYFYLDFATIYSNIPQVDRAQSSSQASHLFKSISSIGSFSTISPRQKSLETNILIEFK